MTTRRSDRGEDMRIYADGINDDTAAVLALLDWSARTKVSFTITPGDWKLSDDKAVNFTTGEVYEAKEPSEHFVVLYDGPSVIKGA